MTPILDHHQPLKGVLQWTLKRSKARNAVNYDVMQALEEALDQLETTSDPDAIRILVFTAEGDHFISGGDLKAFAHLKTAEQGTVMADRMKAILRRIEDLPQLTICLINGDAYGGGCETALAFDQIWIRDTARMGFIQANVGLIPGWGGYQRLIERVGLQRAFNWLVSRNRVNANTALSTGLVDRIVASESFQTSVIDALQDLIHTDPNVMKTLKWIKKGYMTQRNNILSELEAKLFADLWGSEEHAKRVDAFLNK
jgi:enoyl-CoA hydratase